MADRRWRRWNAASLASLVLFAILAAGLGLPWGGTVRAQDDLKEAQEAEAPRAAPIAAVAAPAAADASAEAKAAEKPKTELEFYYDALGVKYTVIFLAISFCFVALIVMNVLALRREAICPRPLVDAFEAQLNEKHFQEAYDLAKSDESFLGHVLAAGLAKLSTGYPQAVEAMQATGEDENMKLEQRLSYIALIGTVSPMVGLLGTVDGMVDAFRVIASSDTQPKPSQLAHGISMALITTLVGLWLAIPAVALFGFLRNRLSRLVFEAASISEQLMGRFAAPAKKP